jgi:hypothetical protein
MGGGGKREKCTMGSTTVFSTAFEKEKESSKGIERSSCIARPLFDLYTYFYSPPSFHLDPFDFFTCAFQFSFCY